MAIDITQVKNAEISLRKSIETAERASQIKSEFLANMSHEIRTPMNAIMGMAELLSESPLNEEQKRYVNIFRKAGENLLQIINDILDISKIDSGHFRIERSDFNLRELVEDTAELAAPRAFAKGIEIFCQVDSRIATSYNGDPLRIRQILVNLIGNAIKFTSHGEVRVMVKPNNEKGRRGNLLFSISDTGIGIPAEAQNKLFQYFQQADTSVTKKFGGTGLGLAICKKLVEMMDGEIWFNSTQGIGTTFYFTLSCPVAPGVSDKKMVDVTADLRDTSVLIVDDRPTNREILREMLVPFGVQITECDNWAVAWELLQNKNFAIVIAEYMLLNGQDAMQFINNVKKAPAYKEIGIILLSSDYVDVTRVELYEMGVAAVLYKPTRRDQLVKEMAKILHKEAPRESAAPPKEIPHSAVKSLNILLVDDSEDNRILIMTYLKNSGHKILESENGEEALAKFKEGQFDLVFMDMQMPVMDGFTATRKIREWEIDHNKTPTPIIALTAYALKEEQEKTIAAGCNGHISKPVSKQQILEAVNSVLIPNQKSAA